VKNIKQQRQLEAIDTKFKVALENSGLSAYRGDWATTDQVLKVIKILWEHTVELVKKTTENQ